MPTIPLTVEQTLAVLAESPRRIAVLTADLTPAQLRAAPQPGEWSVTGVLAHLRACADVWGDAIATILAADAPTIRAIDPRTWSTRTDYPDLAFAPSFDAFLAQRADLLTTLEALPSDAWRHAATVTGSGAPIQRTVQSFAARLARHERTHLKQIARTVAAVRA